LFPFVESAATAKSYTIVGTPVDTIPSSGLAAIISMSAPLPQAPKLLPNPT